MIYVDPYGLWGEGVYNYGRGAEGVLQIAGGFTEASLGAGLTVGSAGSGSLLGGAMVLHGMYHMCTGYHKVFNGEHKDTLTSQVLQSTGLTPAVANFTDSLASLGSSVYVASRNIFAAGSNLRLPTFRDPKNYCRKNFEEYKSSLRSQMEKPYVKDLDLKEYLDMIYRPNAKIGNGSTAAAIRYELETLEKVGDKFHSKKGQESIIFFQKWLRANPTASQGDRAAVENIIKDTSNALGR